ncbi:condensation domain-containing protein [Nonomuraea sp. NBC_01738]|uniref:non-ribosomal peptide synthetase n=1 Tax=Nonomuraea sp. NBC_01738 TaxID=2976003 RepID=UPI002E14F912|nr:condensation domain-containing protein [Nonomuraea sp. NBC_01738]
MDERRARVEDRFRRAAASLGRTIPRRPEGTRPPLSFAQERLWFMEQFAPGTSAYVLPACARVRGPLDVTALRARLDAAVARHEALRMSFPQGRDGEPEARVAARVEVPLRVADAASEAAARALLSAEAARPFDLSAPPLLRAMLVRLAPDDHLVLVAVHHIVADGWSAELLLGELLGGRRPGAPGVGFGDYALWQRDRLTGPYLDRHVSFWRGELAGVEPLELPLDFPRPARQGFRGGWVDFAIDDVPVRELGLAHGATSYMVLLAAFQVLVGRWAGVTDFAVGSPVAGRSRPEFEDVVGLFVNLLPMRARLEGDPGFAELLARTRDAALDVYAHQELPFEKLVAELDPVRDVSRAPLVQVLFALQNYRGGDGEGFELDSATTRFDLELYATETERGIEGRFVYNRELFLRESVERLAGRFETLLRAVAARPEEPVSRVELLPAAERELVTREWNDTGREYPGGTLHGLVFAQAERTPDAVAVVFDGDSLTYRELAARAREVAGALVKGGARVDQPIGVRMERGLDLPVTLLGVLAAGCAYLPMEPGHPAERLRGMAEDAGAEVVLGKPPAPGPEISVHPPEDALAYVIFTSGSTGRPKGVGISHRAIVNRLHWMQEAFTLTPEDRVLHKTPITFDVSVWELFWPLTTGATLVIAQPGGHRDTHYLHTLINQENITTTHFVPSLLAPFLEEADPPKTLKRIICSGEALPPELVRPGIHNLYGPTEAAVDVSWHPCQPDQPRVPIGKPVANTQLLVLDDHLNPVPIGTPGHLHIAGIQLARGYIGRPALTAEAFTPWHNGQRLYKTGDRARWLPTGELEYLGRADNQLKIRGMRVEPGEIEAAIRPRESAVELRDGRLIAYLVGEDDHPDLRSTLPDHMIPRTWVHLDALPLTTSGKLDRKALPDPPETTSGGGEPPRTEAEKAVAAIWHDVLQVAAPTRQDAFFALGGDSIRSLKVVARLRASGYRVELQDLFTHQVLADLAAALRRGEAVQGPESSAFDLLSPADRERLQG